MMRRLAFLAALPLVWAAAAHAGPPAICHALEIGEAPSLPWGADSFAKDRRYSTSRLVDDTVRILAEQPDALVHMETLRRAALYSDRDAGRATTLLGVLMARALNAEAAGTPDALAWFDAGYLAHCYDELGLRLELPCGAERGVIGYAWVKRGLALGGDDAAMELGAALVTVMAGIPEHHEHAARARKLAEVESLVARNLEHHAAAFWPSHRRGS